MTAPASVGMSGISSVHAPALDLPARFLVTGVIGLALLALSAPWTAPLLQGGFYDPRLLAFVHANTLGMVAAIVLGASYQFVPVVLQTPLASVRLGRFSFWLFLAGVLAFLWGMIDYWLIVLAAGGTLLFAAILLYVVNVGLTFRQAPKHDVVSWHVGLATIGVLTATSYGFLLALNKGSGFLAGSVFSVIGAHAVLMLGGWVAVLLIGVAYRLVGMFTLAEHALWRRGAWLELAATVGGAWLLSSSLLLGLGRLPASIGAVLLLIGIGLYAYQLYRLYRGRLRRGIDVHMPFAIAGATFGIAAVGLVVIGLGLGFELNDKLWIAAGWLAIVGFAETSIQGFLYKVATFLVWLNRYAPLAGRERVPRLEDLYSRRLAFAGWGCWSAGVVLVAASIFSADGRLASVAGLIWALGAAAFVVNLTRIGRHWRQRPRRATGETQPIVSHVAPISS